MGVKANQYYFNDIHQLMLTIAHDNDMTKVTHVILLSPPTRLTQPLRSDGRVNPK